MISSQTENHPAKTFLTINLFFYKKCTTKLVFQKLSKAKLKREKGFIHTYKIYKTKTENKTKHLSLR